MHHFRCRIISEALLVSLISLTCVSQISASEPQPFLGRLTPDLIFCSIQLVVVETVLKSNCWRGLHHFVQKMEKNLFFSDWQPLCECRPRASKKTEFTLMLGTIVTSESPHTVFGSCIDSLSCPRYECRPETQLLGTPAPLAPL